MHKRLCLGVALILLAMSLLGACQTTVSGSSAHVDAPASTLATELPDISITINDVVAAGLQRPVQVTHAGDGSNRLFVVEQPGRIRVIRDEQLLATPFLDVSGLVRFEGERGLLGLAFHPDYRVNGSFFINYTDLAGNTVLARYTVSADPDIADATSGTTILAVSQPFANHNGGQIVFGPLDGYLYVGMGDGGSGGDPLNHAQNSGTLLGAMLRIDVDGGTPYAIPPDNPFVGSAGRDEIWAIGLRNPWRFSFDRETGDLYIGDVGQNLWEEISYQAGNTSGGVNFGWRCREGSHPYSSAPPCNSSAWLAGLTDPIVEYNHSEGRSVTGGFVYRGDLFPALEGRYFYADFALGKIWSTYETSGGTFAAPNLELDTSLQISAFGEDEGGELYVVDWGNGTIRRLADVNGPRPDLSASRKQASTASADPGEVVTYTIALRNAGGPISASLSMTDTLPVGLSYVPGSLGTNQGSVDDTFAPELHWQGNLPSGSPVTVTYRVTVTGAHTGSLVNQAHLSGPSLDTLTLASALSVPRSVLTSTHQDYFLPGTQPNQLVQGFAPSIDCDICHSEPIYDEWRGSMMSQAGRDPLMWSALYVANIDAPGAGDYCLRCHTPTGWLEGRSSPPDGSSLHGEDTDSGVTCSLCHRLVDPIPSPTDQAAAIDAAIRSALTTTVPISHAGSGMAIVDPQDRRRGPFELPMTFSYHSAYRTDFLSQGLDPVTSSRLCGTCHNVDNPLLSWDTERGQYWPSEIGVAAPSFEGGDLFPIERTYDEWLNSEYATTGVYAPVFAGNKPDGIVRSCQDCHLQRTSGVAADEQFNPIERDCATTGCLPEHDMTGGNTWIPTLLQDPAWRLSASGEASYLDDVVGRSGDMLRRAATLTVTLTFSGTERVALVRVTNETGHKLPTGYPEGRRIWINLRAYDGTGSQVYESGAYNPATGVLAHDDALQVYEVEQGLTPELASLLGLPAGPTFHFVLNNTVVKDNRIPPRGYSQAAFDRPGLAPVGATYTDGQYWDDLVYAVPATTTRVLVILYYQTASREYIQFLRANGGVDGLTLGELWDASRSPPVVMAVAFDPSFAAFLPAMFRSY